MAVLGVALQALVAVVPIQAQAAQWSLSPSAAEVTRMELVLTSYAVPSTDRNRLIDDLRTGRRQWDSQSGGKPVSTETAQVVHFLTSIDRYADGSVTVARIEEPDPTSGLVAPRKISGCHKRMSDGSTFADGCLISWDAVSWSMSFRADYRFNSGGSSIYRVYGHTYGGAGTISDPKLTVLHSPAGKKDSSRAQGSVTQKGGGVFTRTVGINLTVTPRGGRTSSFGS
ncbi:MAG: hypothetical protein ACRDRH_09540 [Pseudonocardia sp.]